MNAAAYVDIIKWSILGVLVVGTIVLIAMERLSVEGAIALVTGIAAIFIGGNVLSSRLRNGAQPPKP